MKILSIDSGFGDTKICNGTSTNGILNLFKFNSVVGSVKKNQLVNDSRIFDYKEATYYVGEMALSLESSKIIDMDYYANLEIFTPLFIKYALYKLDNLKPDILICGLSISYVSNSGHFKEIIKTYLKELDINCHVEILPQGIGGKLTIDKYGMNFPELNRQFSEGANYLGVDIGFNTIDIFQVINGKTSSNLIRGIERHGIIKIVIKLLTYIKNTYNISFSLKEGKDIIDNKHFKIRGRTYNLSSIISEYKSEYLKSLEDLIENEFGQILDKVDFMYLFGGGAYLFTEKESDFLKIPVKKPEYYNAIGNFIYGQKLGIKTYDLNS